MTRLRASCLAAFVALFPAAAQTPLTTERGETTMAVDVIGRGAVQIEGGVLWERGLSAHTLHLPGPLLRIGLSRRLEIRTGGDGLLWHGSGAERLAGAADLSTELKFRAAGERRWRPGITVAAGLSAPIGHAAFTSGGYDPGVKLAWGKDLPGRIRAAGNVNAAFTTEDGGRRGHYVATLAVERALARRLTAYLEHYRAWPGHARGHNVRLWSAGLFRAIGRSAQVDIGAARETACSRTPWRVTAGFALRLRAPVE